MNPKGSRKKSTPAQKYSYPIAYIRLEIYEMSNIIKYLAIERVEK